MQLHTAHRYFKGGTPGSRRCTWFTILKLDIGTYFDKFREKLNGYVERKFENEKDVFCVVIEMEEKVKSFEEYNIPEDLYEDK